MSGKRTFASVSEAYIQQLRDERHEENTKKSTNWAVKLFKGKNIFRQLFL